MNKTLFTLSLTALLSHAVISYANPLPTVDINKVIIKKTGTLAKHAKFNRANIAGYVSDRSILDLSFSDVEDADMPTIISYLQNNPQVTTVNLEGNNKLSPSAVVQLATINTLISLNLGRTEKHDCDENGICKGGLEAKDVAAFANHPALTSLNLSFNSIGDEGAKILAKNTHLTVLNLGDNNLSDEGGLAIAQNHSLQALTLWANFQITSKTAIALADNPNLSFLTMGQTNVDDAGAIALGEKSHLKKLYLYYTNVGDAGAIALAGNRNITNLDFMGAEVGLKGAKALAANNSLSILDLSGGIFGEKNTHAIGDEGAEAFGSNQSIKQIALENQKITALGAKGLASNASFIDLYLAANYGIGDEGVIALAQHKVYDSLDVSACTVKDKGAIELASTWTYNISADSNFISDAGAAALANNPVIRKLSLVVDEIHDQGAFALNDSYIDYLYVALNRMTLIGISTLEHNTRFKEIEVGGENPFPPKEKFNQHVMQIDGQASMGHAPVCFNSQLGMRCVDRRTIVPALRQG